MTRDQILQALVEAGVIKEGEARDVRASLPPDAPQDMVLSALKGERTDLSGRDVANAVGITVAEWNEAKEGKYEDFSRSREAIRRSEEALARGKERGGFDFHIGGGEEPAWMSADEDEWAGTRFEGSTEALEFVTDEYNKLKAQGVFSLDAMNEIEDKLNTWDWGNPSKQMMAELVELMGRGGASEDEMAPISVHFPSLGLEEHQTGDKERALWEEGASYGGLTSLDPVQQAMQEGTGIVDSSQMSAAEASFLSAGQAAGLMAQNVSVDTRERADYTGSGTVFDRATGQVLSIDEWNFIKTNAEAQEIYKSKVSVNEAVQGLLDSGKFTRRPSKYQGGKGADYDPDAAWEAYRTDRVRAGRGETGMGLIPVEDLAIPSLVVDPLEPWQTETYDYMVGDGRAEWTAMSPRERQMRIKLMGDNGILSPEQMDAMDYNGIMGGHPLNFTAMEIWEQATSVASEFQFSPLDAITAIGQQKAVQEASARRGGGGRGPTYSVPASLREIPDYKTLAQNTKGIFRGQLGREMEDWEVTLYADELKNQHVIANERRIQIHKEAWDDAVAGGSTDVDFTAVEDPNKALDFDIEDAYANEIDRNIRVEDKANQHRLLMDSIAVGQRMI